MVSSPFFRPHSFFFSQRFLSDAQVSHIGHLTRKSLTSEFLGGQTALPSGQSCSRRQPGTSRQRLGRTGALQTTIHTMRVQYSQLQLHTAQAQSRQIPASACQSSARTRRHTIPLATGGDEPSGCRHLDHAPRHTPPSTALTGRRAATCRGGAGWTRSRTEYSSICWLSSLWQLARDMA